MCLFVRATEENKWGRSNPCTHSTQCCRNVSVLFWSQHIDILMRPATCGQYRRNMCFIVCYRKKVGGSWDYKLPPSHAWESFASHAVSKCIHSWHLLRVRFLRYIESNASVRKMKTLTSVRGCYAWLYLHRFIWMCVCAAFGKDAFRMYYLRAVCGEWGEIEIAVRRSDQVILPLHSLRWNVLMSLAFLGTVCVWVSEWSACLSCYDARERNQMVMVKIKVLSRVQSIHMHIYISINIHKYIYYT